MKPYNLTWQNRELALGRRTCIMGILNITPDSFSDGGRFFSLDAALSRAESMIREGADIIDVGGESSRPFSEPVDAEEETARVLPVIEHLAGKISIPISIDTTKAVVARRAMEAGAAIINDISALRIDPKMGEVAAKTGALVVLMHMLGSPKTMQVDPRYDDLIGEIYAFLETAVTTAEAAGIPTSNIIVDPGIGFGKTVSHNLELIHNAHRFLPLGVPLMIGPSRKAFIRKLLAGENRLENENEATHEMVETGTQAAVSAAILAGAHIIRVHDVARTRATATIIDALRGL
ncbi:MAG: dihydropteroate synthase [Desulfosalsimonadaceae bacterium]